MQSPNLLDAFKLRQAVRYRGEIVGAPKAFAVPLGNFCISYSVQSFLKKDSKFRSAHGQRSMLEADRDGESYLCKA